MESKETAYKLAPITLDNVIKLEEKEMKTIFSLIGEYEMSGITEQTYDLNESKKLYLRRYSKGDNYAWHMKVKNNDTMDIYHILPTAQTKGK